MTGKPQLVDVSESAVALQWEPSEDDGGCEITCYIVEYNRVSFLITVISLVFKENFIHLNTSSAGLGHVVESGHNPPTANPFRRHDSRIDLYLPSQSGKSLRCQ